MTLYDRLASTPEGAEPGKPPGMRNLTYGESEQLFRTIDRATPGAERVNAVIRSHELCEDFIADLAADSGLDITFVPGRDRHSYNNHPTVRCPHHSLYEPLIADKGLDKK